MPLSSPTNRKVDIAWLKQSFCLEQSQWTKIRWPMYHTRMPLVVPERDRIVILAATLLLMECMIELTLPVMKAGNATAVLQADIILD